MFKPLKKSLHYVLVFPSLLAVSLTTDHARMGEVPLDHSCSYQGIHYQLSSEGDTGEVKLGFPNVSHSQLLPSQTEIWRLALSTLCFSRKCISLNRCPLMRSALIWQGSFKTVAPFLHSPDMQIINFYEASLYMSCHIRYAHSYGRISNLHLA